MRTAAADPTLAADIRDVVEPRTHTDPELKTDRRYTDLAAREVLARLRAKGYADADLPGERTMRDILNRMGYRLARVRKGWPLKKPADTGPHLRKHPGRPRACEGRPDDSGGVGGHEGTGGGR